MTKEEAYEYLKKEFDRVRLHTIQQIEEIKSNPAKIKEDLTRLQDSLFLAGGTAKKMLKKLEEKQNEN